jgi:ABC-type glutathione transport system ATPase component
VTAATPAATLEFRRATKRNPGQSTAAVENLSLTVPAGEICVLVGPSGCGKTTGHEEFILGNIYAQALEAAGYTVKTQFNLGSEQIANRALKRGQVDAYPEYTARRSRRSST